MPEDFNPNSIDACLAKILTKQEETQKQISEHHTEIMKRIIEHEKDDSKNFREVMEQLEGIKKWRYMVVGGLTTIIFAFEYGLRWLFEGKGK